MLLCPWGSPGKNTGVGCHFLLQGIFLTRGSSPGLLHCRQILDPLCYEGGETHTHTHTHASNVVLVVKNPPTSVGDVKDEHLIPGLGTSSGEGHGNPLQYSCLENPMDSRAWWATVHRVAKSWTKLDNIVACIHTYIYTSQMIQW